MTTNRRRAISVALSCSPQGEVAITAAAEEKAADEILKIARRYGVPVKADPFLAEKLLLSAKEEFLPADLLPKLKRRFPRSGADSD